MLTNSGIRALTEDYEHAARTANARNVWVTACALAEKKYKGRGRAQDLLIQRVRLSVYGALSDIANTTGGGRIA